MKGGTRPRLIVAIDLTSSVKCDCTRASKATQSMPSTSTGSREDGRNGAQQDFHVEPERPIVDVFQIQSHPFLEVGDLIAAADLPQAGKARTHTKAPAICWIIKTTHFIHGQRPRPHETHLAAKDVEQ